MNLSFDPRGRPQSRPVVITECPSLRPSQNFNIKRQSLPAVGTTVGWPSGSLMTPVLYLSISNQSACYHLEFVSFYTTG